MRNNCATSGVDAMIEEGKSFDEDDEDAWREYHSG